MIDRKHLIELIPWYLNGTLKGKEYEDVFDFVSNDPEGIAALEEWKKLHHLIYTEEHKIPPPGIEGQILERIRSQSLTQLSIFHPYAIGLSLVIMALLWAIFRPGMILNWRLSDNQVTSFRIYRSEVDGSKYRLLDEIPANATIPMFTYVDLFFWPFKEYVYYIEGVNVTGSTGISNVIASPALITLPGQAALIFASFFIGYGIMLLIRYRRLLLIGDIRLSTIYSAFI